MKISELMICDWYYDVSLCDDKDDLTDKYREARQVGSIEHFQYDSDSECLFRVNANLKHVMNWLPTTEKNIRPIPLSDEILELNGFKHNVYQDLYGHTVIVENNTIDCLLDTNRVIHITYHKLYVHLLQHALRMFGLVEMANNFKVEK